MARKVFVTSDISVDEALMDVAETSPEAALLWPWLLTWLDDWGRAEASPRRIKARVFPMNPLVTVEMLTDALDVFAEHGLLELYEVAGKAYMAVNGDAWWKYQTHIHKSKRDDDSKSQIPRAPSHTPAESRGVPRSPAETSEAPRVSVPSPSPSPTPTTYDDVQGVHRDVDRLARAWRRRRGKPTIRELQSAQAAVDALPRIADLSDEQLADLVGWAKERSTKFPSGLEYVAGEWPGWPGRVEAPHCGECEESNRMVSTADGDVPCPTCHWSRSKTPVGGSR